VETATGDVIDVEVLGGAKVHGTVTGLADHIAIDEFDALRKHVSAHLRSKITPVPPLYPIENVLALTRQNHGGVPPG